LDPKNVDGERVQKEVEHLAREEGVYVEKGILQTFNSKKLLT